MTEASTTDVLNQLLALHCRSFPMYLAYARPWTHAEDQRAVETIQHIVADQRTMVVRIGTALLRDEVPPETGQFPMQFTTLHDLSLDFLVQEAIRHQQADIASIESCVEELRRAPAAGALAEEALGLAKGHLQAMAELAATRIS